MSIVATKYMNGRGTLLGNSKKMEALRGMLEKAANVDLPLLIMGETGTGKDLVAHEIHALSNRASGPFVVVNTGAVSRDLIASEIFGHVKGAFTSANGDRVGRYEEAHRGSLFLDEIGTMDESMQVSLLRILEDGTFRAVGDRADKASDVRLIAATNVNLDERVASGLFREDLLHRLKVLCIKLPALRDRAEDIPLLTEHFVRMLNREFGFAIRSVAPEAMRYLKEEYDWPGNVRELKNVIAQAAVLAEEGTIEIPHLPRRISGASSCNNGPVDCDASDLPESQSTRIPPQGAAGQERTPRTEAAIQRNDEGSASTATAPVANEGLVMPVGHTFDHVLKEYATLTLIHCKGNKTKAAKMLGISRKTLHDRLNKWDLGNVLTDEN